MPGEEHQRRGHQQADPRVGEPETHGPADRAVQDRDGPEERPRRGGARMMRRQRGIAVPGTGAGADVKQFAGMVTGLRPGVGAGRNGSNRLVTAAVTPALAVTGMAANNGISMFENLPGYLNVGLGLTWKPAEY